MECDEARVLFAAEVDGELVARDSLALAAHLSGCPGCSAELAAQKALRAAAGRAATYFRAPAGLAARIGALAAPSPAPAPEAAATRWAWPWPRLAGALAVALALSWSLFVYVSLPATDERMTDEVVSSHVRSLLASRTTDVASSDRHTVKPWFDGKLDFAPPVRDLTAEGFALVGGRLDYLDHRPVAALVYRHAQHPINVFVLPAAAPARDLAPQARSARGFNTLHWVEGGIAFWAVSDVDPAELAKLAALIRAPG